MSIRRLCLCVFGLLLMTVLDVSAAVDQPLVVINGQNYSRQDFKHWWKYYKDKGMSLPASPDKFINWQLLTQEAEHMELGALPEVKRPLDIFLKARTLMLLKYDEVDSKIKIDDKELRAVYERDYQPRLLISRLDFKDKQAASAAETMFGGRHLSLDEIRQKAAGSPPAFKISHPQWLRPRTLPKSWKGAVNEKSGAVIKPAGGGSYLIYIVAAKRGDDNDFTHKKKAVYEALFSKKQQKLTEDLLRRLQKLYNLKVNRSLLAAIDLTNPRQDNWNKALVTSRRGQATVGYFIEQCRKERLLLQKSPSRNKKEVAAVKQRAMSAMVSNSLTDWAAADRHYENKPPFKWVYQFYRQHRLIKALENRILSTAEKPPGLEAVRHFYETNKGDFRTPELVKIVLVQGRAGDINRLYAASVVAGELLKTAHRYPVTLRNSGQHDIGIKTLSAPAVTALAKMTEGDICPPFADNGKMVVMRLIKRRGGETLPLQKVKNKIIKRLVKIRKEEKRRQYIMNLRRHSNIKVNKSVWQELLTEYHKK